MSTRAPAVTLVILALLVACATTAVQPPRPFTGQHPADTSVDLAGSFELLPAGELTLALLHPCHMDFQSGTGGDVHDVCDAAHLAAVHIIAQLPWQREVAGRWVDASHLAFRPDFAATGLDPLADNAPAVVARPWQLAGASWTPSPAQASQLLDLIGRATDTEPALVRGGEPPKLEASFDTAAPLRAGDPVTLTVKIANTGRGAAYRVIASTWSSVVSLHHQRLSFGTIQPGAEKTRQLTTTVATTETEPDAMLVVGLDEGNGFAPVHVSRRLTIAPAPSAAGADAPPLAVRCSVPGRDDALEAEAGDALTVRCIVDNASKHPVHVELEVAIGKTAAVKRAQPIAAAASATFDVPLIVPHGLALDAAFEIAVGAFDRKAKLEARTQLAGVVHKRRLCKPGELSRDQYRAKLIELRAAVSAGDLTAAQLDRYDAELVTCLR